MPRPAGWVLSRRHHVAGRVWAHCTGCLGAPCLGAVRISTAGATPALFRYGVNQFCTGTSSCYYWELEDWNNPRVHRGESVPSGQVLSMALELNSRNKCLFFLLQGTHRGLRSVLPWEGLGGAAGLPLQFSGVAITFRAPMPRAVAGCAVPDPRLPFGGSAMMGSGATGAAALGAEELSPVWLSCHSPTSSPGPPLAKPALGRKKVFPVHLLTQSSWGDGEVGWWPAAVQRPACGTPCPPGGGGHTWGPHFSASARVWQRRGADHRGRGMGRQRTPCGLGGRWLKQLWRMAQGSGVTAGET